MGLYRFFRWISEVGWEIQQKMGIQLPYTHLENHAGTTVYLWQLPAAEVLIDCSPLGSASPPAPSLQRLHIPENCWVKWGDFLSYKTWKLGMFYIKCQWCKILNRAVNASCWTISAEEKGTFTSHIPTLPLPKFSCMAQSNQSFPQEHTQWKSEDSTSSCSFRCFIGSEVLTHWSFFT